MNKVEKDRLVVPLKKVEDFDVMCHTAHEFAEALGLSIEVVTITHPDDEVDTVLGKFDDELKGFVSEHNRSIKFRQVVREDTIEALLELCSGQWTCMRTSGSVFAGDHFVGSMASALISQSTKPVILAGPEVTGPTEDIEHLFIAQPADTKDEEAHRFGELVAGAFNVSVATIVVDPKGIVYESDYDDENLDRPDVIHAWMKPHGPEGIKVATSLAEYTSRGIMLLSSEARQGLAAIGEPSISLATALVSTSPVVVVGPNAQSSSDPTTQSSSS